MIQRIANYLQLALEKTLIPEYIRVDILSKFLLNSKIVLKKLPDCKL